MVVPKPQADVELGDLITLNHRPIQLLLLIELLPITANLQMLPFKLYTTPLVYRGDGDYVL